MRCPPYQPLVALPEPLARQAQVLGSVRTGLLPAPLPEVTEFPGQEPIGPAASREKPMQ